LDIQAVVTEWGLTLPLLIVTKCTHDEIVCPALGKPVYSTSEKKSIYVATIRG
jgi:hypothetical protein